MHATMAAALVGFISAAAFAATHRESIIFPTVTGSTVLLTPTAAITTLVKPALATGHLAQASVLTSADKRRIENLVRAEILAIVALDAEAAFDKLAPSTQSFFIEPVRFLQAIADKVPPILQTRSFAFLGIEGSAARVAQQVLITDSLGQQWVAEFLVERQASGDWLVEDCIVDTAPGQQA
jgi:hypothetical protein